MTSQELHDVPVFIHALVKIEVLANNVDNINCDLDEHRPQVRGILRE